MCVELRDHGECGTAALFSCTARCSRDGHFLTSRQSGFEGGPRRSHRPRTRGNAIVGRPCLWPCGCETRAPLWGVGVLAMTHDVPDNFIDDEFRQLVARVSELFGDDAACEAVARATVAIAAIRKESPTEWVVMFRAAVKTELRRVLTPQ